MSQEARMVPLDQVRAEPVIEFLATMGVAPAITRWKYFDAQFNRAQAPRGLVILRRDQVAAFLGLTGFDVATDAHRWRCHWLTDWFKSDAAGRGAGRHLLLESLRLHGLTACLGGSAAARRVFLREGALLAQPACLALRKPLRLGAVSAPIARRLYRGLERGLARGQRAAWTAAAAARLRRAGHALERIGGVVERIPLPSLSRVRTNTPVIMEPGVARAIEPLLAPDAAARPCYDLAYLDWLVSRCPVLESHTAYVPGSAGAVAAALLWRERGAGTSWRLALLGRRGDEDAVAAAAHAATEHARGRGGAQVTALVSRLDTHWLALLGGLGFIAARARLPLWLVRDPAASQPALEWAGLSYLDADLGYRF